MVLLEYAVTVPARVLTMDKYYHLMFRKELPYVDSNGNITDPNMKYMNKNNLEAALERISKQHPEVTWRLKTLSQQRHIARYEARNGRVTRTNERFNEDDSSKLAA